MKQQRKLSWKESHGSADYIPCGNAYCTDANCANCETQMQLQVENKTALGIELTEAEQRYYKKNNCLGKTDSENIINAPKCLQYQDKKNLKTSFEFYCDEYMEALGFGKKYTEIDARKTDIPKEALKKIDQFRYFEGGYPRGYRQKVIYKKNDKYYYAELPPRMAWSKEEPFLCQVSKEDVIDFLYSIYDRTQIFDWDKIYSSNMCDGNEWGVSFGFENGDLISRYGHMNWPKSYKEDKEHLMRCFSKIKAKHSNSLQEEMARLYMVDN